MGKKKKGVPVVDKGFASLEDDFFAAGDEGSFMTDEEDLAALAALEASVEDAPMEDGVPGDDAVPGDEDVPGDDEMPVVEEEMVATEAGGPAAEAAIAEPVLVEPAAEEAAAEMAPVEEEGALPDGDDVTEVDPEDDLAAQQAALAEAARNLPGGSGQEETMGADPASLSPQLFEPSADESGAWSAAVALLVGEAEGASKKHKARYLAEASRIARMRLGDSAESLKQAHAANDIQSTDFSERQLAEALNLNGDWEAMKALTEKRAGAEKDNATSAELLQDAALLARHQLGGGEEVKRLLEASLARNAKDYFSLQLMLEYALPRSEWSLAESTLERMAELAGGTRAAAFHYQRGRILMEHLSRSDDGLEAFRKAHQADRNHVSTTLALQSLYAAGGQHKELCDLYAEEGERLGGADGQVYFAEAARIARDALQDPKRSVELFRSALAAKESSALRHELQSVFALQEIKAKV